VIHCSSYVIYASSSHCVIHHTTSFLQAVIFVVDSTDRIRMCVAKDELDAMIACSDIKSHKVPVLLFANKKDLPTAMEPAEVTGILGLHTVNEITWHLQPSNSLSGEGINEGIEWLAEQVSKGQVA
jgi:ADP-ribosylation factor-like protein 6